MLKKPTFYSLKTFKQLRVSKININYLAHTYTSVVVSFSHCFRVFQIPIGTTTQKATPKKSFKLSAIK